MALFSQAIHGIRPMTELVRWTRDFVETARMEMDRLRLVEDRDGGHPEFARSSGRLGRDEHRSSRRVERRSGKGAERRIDQRAERRIDQQAERRFEESHFWDPDSQVHPDDIGTTEVEMDY